MSETGTQEISEEAPVEVEPNAVTEDSQLTTGSEATTETSDETFTVKYNGEEIEVTQSELLNGYLRQQDYTRKTQELAELRAFNEAYQENPEQVVRALAEANGLTLAQAQALAESADDEYVDPVEAKLAALEAKLAMQEATVAEKQLIAETENAIAKYDLGVTADQLMAFAVDKRIGDPFTAAELMSVQVQRDERARQTAEIIGKKRQASVVAGGSVTADGAVSQNPYAGMSFGEEVMARMSSRS